MDKDVTPGGPGDEATEAVPEDKPESNPEGTAPKKAESPEPPEPPEVPEDAAARIAELQRQLDEAAPILKAHQDAEEARKTELQKVTERAAALESELVKLQDEAARARVAEKTGLSSAQVAHLKGATEAELLEAAKAFASAVKGSLQSRPKPTVGNGASSAGSEPDRDSPSALADRIRKAMPY